MRTANPTLNDQVFANAPAALGGQVMTLQGVVNKTFILALLLVISGGFSWQLAVGAGESLASRRVPSV